MSHVHRLAQQLHSGFGIRSGYIPPHAASALRGRGKLHTHLTRVRGDLAACQPLPFRPLSASTGSTKGDNFTLTIYHNAVAHLQSTSTDGCGQCAWHCNDALRAMRNSKHEHCAGLMTLACAC